MSLLLLFRSWFSAETAPILWAPVAVITQATVYRSAVTSTARAASVTQAHRYSCTVETV